ncbi:MAG: enoyl-CoA hydratase/isomerase family protein [Dehalococcoidia bacterium]|nr:enoyl-CoA hydratase/isomerase family protein [Dehalococcoidia bacterium]
MVDYGRYKNLIVDKADKVATLTFNRPERLNAFNWELHSELEDVLLDLNVDEEVHAIVITGAGRAFSAGGDLRGMQDDLDQPPMKRIPMYHGRLLVMNLMEVRQHNIPAVNGDAEGCDVIMASETARIGDPHVRVGLVAGDGGAIIWPALVGVAKAKELLMTGDLVPASEAERIGLVNRVLPQEEVLPAAMEMATRLENAATWAIRWTKHSINKQLRAQMEMTLDMSLALESLTYISDDHKEAVAAFLEKRKPNYTGL